MTARPNDRVVLAICLSLLALLFFDFMGLIIKHLSPRYSAAELSAWRNVFGLVPSFLALMLARGWHAQGRPIKVRQWKLALSRGIIVCFAQLMFYMSLGALDFATATTISYANALFVTALAVPLLGEKVGWVRWVAVIIGFVGVIMVMGPGREAFTIEAVLPAGAAALYALTAVTARLFDENVPTPLVNLWSSSMAVVGAIILAMMTGGFSSVANGDLIWIVAMGCFGGAAVLCLIIAYRMTEQSNLAPFSYFGIPLAFWLGWLFYDEAPFDDLFPGSLLIIAGGLMVIWRERRARRLKA
ncbi:MAG: DMT family transporter [Rhodobacteraceae bacterium]|nr:DMT family transporter [Paracoccaceae bacterium]